MNRSLRRLLVIPILLASVLGSSCSSSGSSASVESVVVALPRLESNALHWIAEDRNFFRRNGLRVTLYKPDSGLAALELLKSQVDIAGTSEFPVVELAFQRASIRAIGCIDEAEYIVLEGRKDTGIQQISDLEGKRVGTIPGTIADFYLGRFLELNGMNRQDITAVDIKTPENAVEAIIAGSVDAVVIAQPFAGSIEHSLGANAIAWRVQNSQPLYGLLVTTEEWIENHPGLVTRYLESLAQAEDYLLRDPAGAQAIVQKRLNVDATFVQAAWSRNQFSLALDQALITAMEDEARWMIANKLTTETTVPNFLDYIYEDALQAVKPDAVDIIR
jgi:NitT/TauT family transport system substrate-binding protein